jgi:chromate transport protein ChrA
LFIETFYLSAFTFGGGYMIVSLMKKKFVNEYHWIVESRWATIKLVLPFIIVSNAF